MRVNSQDIISKETQASTRNLLAAASSVLVVQYFGYNSKDWDLLGRAIAPTEFKMIALLILAFLLVNHFVKWSSDFYLYRKWFSMNEVPAGGMDEIGRIASSHGPIKGLAQRLKWLIGNLESIMAEIDKLPIAPENPGTGKQLNLVELSRTIESLAKTSERISGDIDEANKLLSQLDKRFVRVSFVVKFIVFGWYFALPVLIGLGAVWSLT